MSKKDPCPPGKLISRSGYIAYMCPSGWIGTLSCWNLDHLVHCQCLELIAERNGIILCIVPDSDIDEFYKLI